ncbi:MAG: hypothetical protein ABIO79_07420 [Ferruginibacter sp.]
MRTLYFRLAGCILLFATVSCQKPLQDDNVCEGLLRMGTADSAKFLMPGVDWAFKCFAYTPNGKDIIYKDAFSHGILRTTNTDTMRFYFDNEGGCIPTFSSGTNDLKIQAAAYSMLYSKREVPVLEALNNAICYAIKDDILYIHFRESEGKNLFILQRK